MPSPHTAPDTAREIVRARVATQLAATIEQPAEVVRAYGAVQAQDYRASLWGIALRTPDATEADVERAIAERAIVRTWPMRGTLHFVAPEDVRWMLRVLTPRVISKSAARYRQLALDADVLARSRDVLERALSGGRQLTRPEAFAVLERAGIATASQRGVHVLARLAMQGVLCFGAYRGKQPTFALLEEWIPRSRAVDDDEGLGDLARRYFTSHGPATADDFAWWTGLPLGIARRAIDVARGHLEQRGEHWRGAGPSAAEEKRAAPVHLLPPFDEYTVAYRDRSAFLDPAHSDRTRYGIMSPVVVIGGRIEGTWSRATKKDRVLLRAELFDTPSASVRRALGPAADRYGRFLDRPAALEIAHR